MSGNQDPWGQGGRDQNGPPDLDELFRRMKKKFSEMNANKGSGSNSNKPGGGGGAAAGFLGFGFILIVFLAMWVISGIYIVKPAERAVVLRFGKYYETTGPGPHWIPRFIDSYSKIDVEKRQTARYNAEMLTRDENIISVELTTFYRVKDPRDYLYSVTSPEQSLQEVMRSALRQEVGNSSLDQVLTTGREKIRENTFKNIERILEGYKTGLEVVEVNLQEVRPPRAVIDAFDDVQRATEDSMTYVNDARAVANKIIAEAQGQVQQILNIAEADKQTMIAQAEAGVAGYQKVLQVYQNPALRAVTRERMYLETMESMLSKSSKVLVDTKGSNNMMYLPLDKIINRQQQNTGNRSSAQFEQSDLSNDPSTTSLALDRSTRDDSSRRGDRWQ